MLLHCVPHKLLQIFGVFSPSPVLREEFFTLTSLRSRFLCQKVPDKWISPAFVQSYFLPSLEGAQGSPREVELFLSRVMAWTIRHWGRWTLTRQLGRFELKSRAFKRQWRKQVGFELMTSSSQKSLRKEYTCRNLSKRSSSDLPTGTLARLTGSMT